jgi:DNA-binding NtrC family response regulator
MKRILIADDDEQIRGLLVDYFHTLGYETVVAANGAEALANLSQYDIDCILSDLIMPDMDGIELLKQIRMQEKKIPFIIITGFPTVDSAIEAMKEGAYDYVSKPLKLNEVRFKVERVLHIKTLERSNRRLTGVAWAFLISIPIWLILGLVFGKLLGY